jgi:hypothetical protein
MFRIIRNAALGAVSAAAVASLVLAASGVANASINTANDTSTFLAGHATRGNGLIKFYTGWAQLVDLPNPGSAVPPDSLVQGIAISKSDVNSGPTYGLGAVWDDTIHSTCGAGMWTMEGSTSPYTPPVGAPEPVPAANLTPLTEDGGPICLSPGSSEFIRPNLNNRHHLLDYIVGPSEGDNDIVNTAPIHTSFSSFAGVGEGVSTCNSDGVLVDDFAACPGTVAQDITTGSVFSFNSFAVGILLGHGHTSHQAVGNPSSNVNYATYTGTQTGGAPSVSNPITLTPSGFTRIDYGSYNTVTAP